MISYTTRAAENAERDNEIVDGIKGKSVLTDGVDLVKCILIDYMWQKTIIIPL